MVFKKRSARRLMRAAKTSLIGLFLLGLVVITSAMPQTTEATHVDSVPATNPTTGNSPPIDMEAVKKATMEADSFRSRSHSTDHGPPAPKTPQNETMVEQGPPNTTISAGTIQAENLTVGSMFHETFTITNAVNVTAWNLAVTWDQTVLHVVNYTFGPYWTNQPYFALVVDQTDPNAANYTIGGSWKNQPQSSLENQTVEN